jgi:hypothetical protein
MSFEHARPAEIQKANYADFHEGSACQKKNNGVESIHYQVKVTRNQHGRKKRTEYRSRRMAESKGVEFWLSVLG